MVALMLGMVAAKAQRLFDLSQTAFVDATLEVMGSWIPARRPG
jgi:hypothetical protein